MLHLMMAHDAGFLDIRAEDIIGVMERTHPGGDTTSILIRGFQWEIEVTHSRQALRRMMGQ